MYFVRSMSILATGRRGLTENKHVKGELFLVTHLGTVQVLMLLQEFIRLLYRHFIVAIIKVI